MTTQPISLSRDLPKNRAIRAQVGGEDLVVWRNSSGVLAAWNNRCPHRGMRLSHGFVRGDRLACLYHGWQYGASGKCEYMPAHPELDPPETIRTQAFSVCEEHGVIWVNVAGQAEALADTKGLEPLRSMTIGSGIEQVRAQIPVTAVADAQTPIETEHGRLRFGTLELAVLCTPLTDRETMVLVLIDPAATLQDRRAASRWCEALRRATLNNMQAAI